MMSVSTTSDITETINYCWRHVTGINLIQRPKKRLNVWERFFCLVSVLRWGENVPYFPMDVLMPRKQSQHNTIIARHRTVCELALTDCENQHCVDNSGRAGKLCKLYVCALCNVVPSLKFITRPNHHLTNV